MPVAQDNGGSTLQAYDLEVDDGLQGILLSQYVGLNRTVEVNTVLGRTYRFRYRVSNILGWSGFSNTTYILAAYVPEKPCEKPQLLSVNASSIIIQLSPCGESNGDLVTNYVIYIQKGFIEQPIL